MRCCRGMEKEEEEEEEGKFRAIAMATMILVMFSSLPEPPRVGKDNSQVRYLRKNCIVA